LSECNVFVITVVVFCFILIQPHLRLFLILGRKSLPVRQVLEVESTTITEKILNITQ